MPLTFEHAPKFTLSANEIRQYSECARKRYYASRDCLALRVRKTSGNLMLGSRFHETIAYYYTQLDQKIKDAGLVNPTVEDCKDLFNSITPFDEYIRLKALDEGGEEPEALEAKEQAIYENIVAGYMPNIYKDLVEYEVVGCEEAFQIDNWPINDVRYHGFIDMVVKRRDNGKIYFFEHKTCANFRPDIYNRFDIQLHIYDAWGAMTYGNDFGGMILNEVKKAKTLKGYDDNRCVFEYTEDERKEFLHWLTKKTEGLVSPDNHHEPCNSYMGCKMCEYNQICMQYGYSVPKTTEEVLDDAFLTDDDNEPLYMHDPRIEDKDNE